MHSTQTTMISMRAAASAFIIKLPRPAPEDRNNSLPTEVTQANARACSTPVAMPGRVAGSRIRRSCCPGLSISTRAASRCCHGNQLQTGRLLNISRNIVRARLEKIGELSKA